MPYAVSQYDNSQSKCNLLVVYIQLDIGPGL